MHRSKSKSMYEWCIGLGRSRSCLVSMCECPTKWRQKLRKRFFWTTSCPRSSRNIDRALKQEYISFVILDCRSNLHLHLLHNKSFIIPTFVTSNLRHLAVADKCVMLDVKIPHLHEILFPRVHVREVVDHLWRLDSEPSLANYHNQTM